MPHLEMTSFKYQPSSSLRPNYSQDVVDADVAHVALVVGPMLNIHHHHHDYGPDTHRMSLIPHLEMTRFKYPPPSLSRPSYSQDVADTTSRDDAF